MFRVGTERSLHGIGQENMNSVRQDANKSNGTKERESQIPQGHCAAPVPRTAILEIGLSQDDAYTVEDDSKNGNNGRVHHPMQNVRRFVVDFIAVKSETQGRGIYVRGVLQSKWDDTERWSMAFASLFFPMSTYFK